MLVGKLWALMPLLLVLPGIHADATEQDDLNTRLMRASVKIDHPSSTATGLILTTPNNRRVLITAAHVFEKTRADSTTLLFHRLDSEGVYQKVPMTLALKKDGKPTWTKHPSEDVAAIVVEPPDGVDLPCIPVDLLASDDLLREHHVHPGDEVSILGFPHRNESGDAGFPVLRGGRIASFPLLPTGKTRTFLISANTFEGDSGGPVYLTRSGSSEPCELILGLISGQRFLDEHMHMVYGSATTRHRLGLGIVVHASFLRETVDALP